MWRPTAGGVQTSGIEWQNLRIGIFSGMVIRRPPAVRRINWSLRDQALFAKEVTSIVCLYRQTSLCPKLLCHRLRRISANSRSPIVPHAPRRIPRRIMILCQEETCRVLFFTMDVWNYAIPPYPLDGMCKALVTFLHCQGFCFTLEQPATQSICLFTSVPFFVLTVSDTWLAKANQKVVLNIFQLHLAFSFLSIKTMIEYLKGLIKSFLNLRQV
jgi:hypothetical protein